MWHLCSICNGWLYLSEVLSWCIFTFINITFNWEARLQWRTLCCWWLELELRFDSYSYITLWRTVATEVSVYFTISSSPDEFKLDFIAKK